MAMQRLELIRRRGGFYSLLIGIVVGSVLTALVVPFISGESLTRSNELSLGEGGTGLDPAGGGVGGRVPGTSAGGLPGAGTGALGTGGDGGPGGPRTGSPSGATDVGVTAKTVKIGFLLLDTARLSQVGIAVPGVDPETQRRAFQAQLDDINARGGINDRKAVGVYEKFDVLSQPNMREACLAMRDREVFGVVAAGGFQGEAILCLTEEGKTPLVNQGSHGTPTEYLQRSRGLLFSLYPHSDRLMANWVAELHRQGVLKGKRIGIVSQRNTNPNNTVVGGGLIPALMHFGYTVTHHSDFSADQHVASSQVPFEVQAMSNSKVDLVMLTASTILSSQFVQTADNQQYRPRYTITDWASMNNDVSNQNMPGSYGGTILITTYRVGEQRVEKWAAETPPEKECRRIYEEGTGRQMGPRGSNEHGLLVTNCTALKAFELGAVNAGAALTRASFSLGMQAIGRFPMSFWGGGTFAAGKYDAADYIRTTKWFSDCRCLKPVSEFSKSRF